MINSRCVDENLSKLRKRACCEKGPQEDEDGDQTDLLMQQMQQEVPLEKRCILSQTHTGPCNEPPHNGEEHGRYHRGHKVEVQGPPLEIIHPEMDLFIWGPQTDGKKTEKTPGDG